jgi:hypothetical protein
MLCIQYLAGPFLWGVDDTRSRSHKSRQMASSIPDQLYDEPFRIAAVLMKSFRSFCRAAIWNAGQEASTIRY